MSRGYHKIREEDAFRAFLRYQRLTGDGSAECERDGNHYRLRLGGREFVVYGAYAAWRAIEDAIDRRLEREAKQT